MTQKAKKICKSRNERQTLEIASELASRLLPGDAVLLEGTLGAGKTVFVRGVVDALGGDAGEVASPTFTLVRKYEISDNANFRNISSVYHVDLYRLKKSEQEALALDEILSDPKGVVLIEWANQLERPVPGYKVNIKHLADDFRQISIERC